MTGKAAASFSKISTTKKDLVFCLKKIKNLSAIWYWENCVPLWARSQILKVLSREDEMSVSDPFCGKTRFLTTPSWPWRSKTAFPGNEENVIKNWSRFFLSSMHHRKHKHHEPVSTFHTLITPFSKPVARSRVLFPFGPLDSLVGRAAAADLGGLGPKASAHTGWPQLKLLSALSVSPSCPSLWARVQSRTQITNVGGVQLEPVMKRGSFSSVSCVLGKCDILLLLFFSK